MFRDTNFLLNRSRSTETVAGAMAFKESPIAGHLPFMSAIEDDIIMTRDGDLIASVLVDGLNSLNTEDEDIDFLRRAIADLTGVQGPQFGFYVHKITIPDKSTVRRIDGAGFAAEVDKRWSSFLGDIGLVRRDIVFTICYRAKAVSKIPFLAQAMGKQFDEDVVKRKDMLNEAMNYLQEVAGSLVRRRLTVSSGEWLGLFARILGQEYSLIKAEKGQFLSAAMTAFDIEFDNQTFTIVENGKRRFGTIFSIKTYPAETWSTMLDGLSLPYDICVTNSFTPIRPNVIEERIKRIKRVMHSTDDAAKSLEAQLEEAADDVASGRQTFGDHHATVQIICDDLDELNVAASEIKRVGQDVGALMVRESFAARTAYFAQYPANYTYRARKAAISADNFASFAALHSISRGRPAEKSPWGTPISAFPTLGASAYKFNFHQEGKVGEEPSPGHTLVLGVPGSGKTIGAAFLMAQARRVDARIFVFDKDLGLEMATRALGGSYSQVKIGEATGFNPLLSENGARGEGWLIDWLTSIFEREKKLTTTQRVGLQKAVKEFMNADDNLRHFNMLPKQLASIDDGGDLKARASEWASGGRYAWLFADNAQEAAINMSSDVVGIDMTEILDTDLERSALLAYLFRRIEVLVEDRKPTIIVLDEAWKLLDDEYFVKKLKDWLVTMRKKNCVVMMMTQTPTHLRDSKVGSIIIETSTTQVLFPNVRAKPQDYNQFNLNLKEQEFLTNPAFGLRTALVRSAGDSVFLNVDLSALRELVPVLGGGEAGAQLVPADWRTNPNFWKEVKK